MSNKKIVDIERRSHQRISLAIRARLKLAGGVLLKGCTRNISFGGTFVEFEKIPIVTIGDYFSLELFSRVQFTCKVIHLNHSGIGFQFDFILIKYYEHFKKMMLQNAPDPERLIKELGRQP